MGTNGVLVRVKELKIFRGGRSRSDAGGEGACQGGCDLDAVAIGLVNAWRSEVTLEGLWYETMIGRRKENIQEETRR